MTKSNIKKNKSQVKKKYFSLSRDKLLNEDLCLVYELKQFLLYQLKQHKSITSLRGRRRNRPKNKNIIKTLRLIDKVLRFKYLEVESAFSRLDSSFMQDLTSNIVTTFPPRIRIIRFYVDVPDAINAGVTITCPESLNSLDPDFKTFTLWGNILENSNWVKNK